MATAEELLNSLSTTNSETEEHIVIGNDRFITVPKSLKRIAVQYDHDVETVTFDCPRFWDDLDMYGLAVYINYIRSDGYADSYATIPYKDATNDKIMHFDWTISRNVTMAHGGIVFLVCIKSEDEDEDGNEIIHWNSELCRDMYVSEGMENEEQEELSNSDLVTRLLQINVTKEVVDQLLEDATEKANRAETAKNETLAAQTEVANSAAEIRNSYANAIKGKADGEIIRVDDVSPIEHDVECWVRGKNLIDVSNFIIQDSSTKNCAITAVGSNYITITTTDGYNGNGHCASSNTLREVCPQIKSGRTYTLTATSSAFMQSAYFSQADVYWDFGKSLVITEELLDCRFDFYGLASIKGQGTGDCIISNIQIEEGPVATDYEPYVDPTTVTVTGCGKNLISYPFVDTTKTTNGITFTDNGDGSITLNGTATETAYFFLQNNANYGGIINSILTDSADNGVYTASKRIYYNATAKTLTINIISGTTLSNEIIYPQLEVGLAATDYEPYIGATYTPESDGSVDITSISPTTTIFTDTPGVKIEAEYNRDTTKAMTSYIFTDEIKDEIVARVEDDVADMLASLNSYAESLIGGDS